jgi:hypothetical protein
VPLGSLYGQAKHTGEESMKERKNKRSQMFSILLIILVILLFLAIIYLAKKQKADEINKNMLCRQSIDRVIHLG